MLINREWKHSFESVPNSSVTSLISLWDLMYDKNGTAWVDSDNEDSGAHLDHDIICFNKKLYIVNDQISSSDTKNIDFNTEMALYGSEGSEQEETQYPPIGQAGFEKFLFNNFGFDIAIPFYSTASRPEKVTKTINNQNYTFYKYDKNAVIPYKDLFTFSNFSINAPNCRGSNLFSNFNNHTLYSYINSNYPFIKVAPYNEETKNGDNYELYLRGKNEKFLEDNNIDDDYLAYNNICIKPNSNFASMLVYRCIFNESNYNLTGYFNTDSPFYERSAYSTFNVETYKDTLKEVLQNTFVWIRAPFFADYIKPNSYNQNLNKDSKVVHKDLILSENGDFNEYADSVVISQESPQITQKSDKSALDTLPYISKTAPGKDLIKEELSTKDADYWEKITEDLDWSDFDITGIPIPVALSKNYSNTNDNSRMFCPFIYWNTEYMEKLNTSPEYYFKDFSEKLGGNTKPIFIRKFGNLYADGRIFSPTIDELWISWKELVCGRDDSESSKKWSIPKGTNTYVLNKNHRISYNNKNNLWNFEIENFQKSGDPLNFELGSFGENDEVSETKVTDFINSNNTINYFIYDKIKELQTDLQTKSSLANTDDKLKVSMPFGSENSLMDNSSPSIANDTDENNIFAPRENPYSLRELEALIKGERFNFEILISWIKKFVVINSSAAKIINKQGQTSLYQFHKNYNQDFENSCQFNQTTSASNLSFDTASGSKLIRNTTYISRKTFAAVGDNKGFLNLSQNYVSPSQVYMAADGTWRSVFEKPRTLVITTTR